MVDSVAASFSPPVTAQPPTARARAPEPTAPDTRLASKEPHRGDNVDVTC